MRPKNDMYITAEDMENGAFPIRWERRFANVPVSSCNANEFDININFDRLDEKGKTLGLEILEILLTFRFVPENYLEALLKMKNCDTECLTEMLDFLFDKRVINKFMLCSYGNDLNFAIPDDAVLFYYLDKGSDYLFCRFSDIESVKNQKLKKDNFVCSESIPIAVEKMFYAIKLYMTLSQTKGSDLASFIGHEIFRCYSDGKVRQLYFPAVFSIQKNESSQNIYLFDAICGENYFKSWSDNVYMNLQPYFTEKDEKNHYYWEYNRQFSGLPILILLVNNKEQAKEVADVYERVMNRHGPKLILLTREGLKNGMDQAELLSYSKERGLYPVKSGILQSKNI